MTPLHLVSASGIGLGVKLLLDYKADPFMEDANNNTALSVADNGGNVGCARLLQRAMAKATVADGAADSSLTLRGTSLESHV